MPQTLITHVPSWELTPDADSDRQGVGPPDTGRLTRTVETGGGSFRKIGAGKSITINASDFVAEVAGANRFDTFVGVLTTRLNGTSERELWVVVTDEGSNVATTRYVAPANEERWHVDNGYSSKLTFQVIAVAVQNPGSVDIEVWVGYSFQDLNT